MEKIIILKNEYERFVIDVEEFKGNEYIGAYFFEEYQLDECESWEELEEKANDALNYYIDNLVPIYYDEIDKEFNDLTDWRIDDLIKEYCIEYRGDFSRFKQEILFYDMYEVAYQELHNILESIEAEEIGE